MSLDRLFIDSDKVFQDPARFAATVSVAASELFFVDLLAVNAECFFAFAEVLAFRSEVFFGDEVVADEPLKSLLKLPRSWLLAHVADAARIVAMSQIFLFTAGMLTTTNQFIARTSLKPSTLLVVSRAIGNRYVELNFRFAVSSSAAPPRI